MLKGKGAALMRNHLAFWSKQLYDYYDDADAESVPEFKERVKKNLKSWIFHF